MTTLRAMKIGRMRMRAMMNDAGPYFVDSMVMVRYLTLGI